MKKYYDRYKKEKIVISKAGLKHFKIPKGKWLKILHDRLSFEESQQS